MSISLEMFEVMRTHRRAKSNVMMMNVKLNRIKFITFVFRARLQHIPVNACDVKWPKINLSRQNGFRNKCNPFIRTVSNYHASTARQNIQFHVTMWRHRNITICSSHVKLFIDLFAKAIEIDRRNLWANWFSHSITASQVRLQVNLVNRK